MKDSRMPENGCAAFYLCANFPAVNENFLTGNENFTAMNENSLTGNENF